MSVLRVAKLQGITQTNFEITVPSTHKLIVSGILRANSIQNTVGNNIWNPDSSGNITISGNMNVVGSLSGTSLSASQKINLPVWTTATRPTVGLVNGVMGFNTTIKAVELYTTTDGWIDLGSTRPDGSTAANAATSVSELQTSGGVTTNGVYWLKTSSLASPYQTYVVFDSVYDGGGWELAYNIDANNTTTQIGGIPHWDNTTFWNTANENNNTSTTPWTTNVKTKTFDQRVISEVLILLHNRSGYTQANCRGWSVYTNTQQTNKTFLTIHNQGNNSVMSSGGRKTSANYVGNLTWNNRRPQSRGGDLFIDGVVNGSNNASDNLVVNATGYWGSDGWGASRLTTTAGSGNSSYGHTFAGMGIRHAHSGWGFYYGMAPVSAYCEPPAVYGNQDANGFNQASSPNSGNLMLTQCDNRGWANGFISCGYSVFVR